MTNDYYKTKDTVKEYIKMAEGHNGAELIEKMKAFLTPGSKMLEIGSGPGTDWEILNKSFEVTGSDFSEEFLKHLKQTNPGGNFLELDAITLEIEEQFDAIYSNKVLHHLNDEEIKASIKRQNEILKPGGIICHSFWRGKGSEIYNGLFVNYHTETDLKVLYGDFFEVLLTDTYLEFETNDSLLFIGKKK